MVTDHDTLQGLREKKNGFYGDVLVLIGTELSTREGHLLTLGIEEVPHRDQPVPDLLREIEEAGGMGFVAHGESERTPWNDWSVAPLTGMEVYSFSSDLYQDEVVPVALKFLFLPPRLFYRSVLDHPGRHLARWDDLLRSGEVIAIGSVDAHQRVRLLGWSVDHYDTVFKVVQTHAWAADLSRQGILEAFRKGHLYIGFDLITPVRNFLFWAEGNGGMAIMGDEMVYSEEIQLRVFVPKKGRIHLLKDGELLTEKEGTFLEIQPPGPGVYRVEVYRGNRLWILSNPIYVQGPAGTE